jgi:DNA-binding NarL/FixJ family response regulator
MAVRVFLLDEHELVRRGVAQMLSTHEDLEVVGDAGTADEAVRRGDALRPDVAVLDVRPGEDEMDGIEVCREIRSRQDGSDQTMQPSAGTQVAGIRKPVGAMVPAHRAGWP